MDAESKTVYVEVESTKENAESKENLFATTYDNRRLILQPVQVQDVPTLSFTIEKRSGLDILVFNKFGCRSATDTELELWNAFNSVAPRLALSQSENEKFNERLDYWKTKLSEADSKNLKLQSELEAVRAGLEKIANWELPATGKFWDDDKTQPLSYETAYGSNGVRDYIKSIALKLLKTH